MARKGRRKEAEVRKRRKGGGRRAAGLGARVGRDKICSDSLLSAEYESSQ